jgi:hypothetical protein
METWKHGNMGAWELGNVDGGRIVKRQRATRKYKCAKEERKRKKVTCICKK